MKIKMLSRAAGALVAEPGDVIDVPPAAAKELIAGHFAVAADEPTTEGADGPQANRSAAGTAGDGGRSEEAPKSGRKRP